MSNKTTTELEVHQGVPDQEQLVHVLQTCFDGPRSPDHVEWKYGRFPDFEDKHVFFISDEDGNIVALRRLFYKQMRIDGRKIDAFVGGDSCVVPSHRENGLFSTLLAQSTAFEQHTGRELSLSYNKHGGRTFGSKIRRNWNYQSLPLFVRVFTPELVLPRYGKRAVENESLSVLIGSQPFTTVYRHLPDTLVAALVEAASADNALAAVDHFRTKRTDTQHETTTSFTGPLHDDAISELVAFYTQQSESYSAQFRRERQDLEHMLSHPCLEDVFRIYDQEGLAGFAVLIAQPMDPIKEGRVLDLVAKNSRIHHQLTKQVELAARKADMDIVSMLSQRAPQDNWARVDEQVLMWKAHTELPPIDTESTLLGFYDVV